MAFCRHDRFADDVGEIGPDCEIPIEPDRPQGRAGEKAAAHAEKASEDADEEADDRQINRADVCTGDGKKHGYSERPLKSRSRKGVMPSSTTACPMIRRMDTPAKV